MSDHQIEKSQTGAWVKVDGETFYRDGRLYGSVLPNVNELPTETVPMPALTDQLVLTYSPRVNLVTAVQVTEDNIEAVARWCGGDVVTTVLHNDRGRVIKTLNVPTHVGIVHCLTGKFVVKDHNNHHEIMSQQDFHSQYELI